jgi:hypothetical protein
MGFLFIIPFIVLFVWIIRSTRRDLVEYQAAEKWHRIYWALFALGFPLGLWLAAAATLHLPEMVLHGLPIPISFERLIEEEWVVTDLPNSVRLGAALADVVGGAAILLLPFKVVALFAHFKKATEPKS